MLLHFITQDTVSSNPNPKMSSRKGSAKVGAKKTAKGGKGKSKATSSSSSSSSSSASSSKKSAKAKKLGVLNKEAGISYLTQSREDDDARKNQLAKQLQMEDLGVIPPYIRDLRNLMATYHKMDTTDWMKFRNLWKDHGYSYIYRGW
eukprot:TRINITY_DN1159_c1_g1_i2.p1 TRINITY_DN1159_c1_g1~~TRINITY_DN1159_c1_g1_i2.p1  ORF type:complete len:147 (-),score=43.46 TRINITY_DN1159_c1_g1_i2:46-486(-)